MSNTTDKTKRVPRSYGLLVFRIVPFSSGGREIQYLIARPSIGGTGENKNPWYLPKGKKNGSETPRETAIREVYEETGIKARIISQLGLVKYKNGRKEVAIYLAKYTGGIVEEDGSCLKHDWENDDVRFVNSFDAKKMLREEFRGMIDLAEKVIL